MRILIVRLGLAVREKENSYNVQEIGLAKALQSYGHDAMVAYFHNAVKAPEKSRYYDFVTYYPCIAVGHQILFSKKVMRDIQCDGVIIFCDNKLSANTMIDWCRERELPYVCYFGLYHTDSDNKINILLSRIIGKINYRNLKKSNNVTKTNTLKQILEQNQLPVKEVIPVGLDLSLLHRNKTKSEMELMRSTITPFQDELVLLFVGRLTSVKRPLMAIKIMEHLNEKGIKASLILIGSGVQQEAVQEAIAKSKYGESVLYKDKVQYSEMYKYYLASDFFLNFSDIEIFGMAILEAMYYRCCVLAHTAPGPCDIIENEKNGFLLDNYDIDQWCKIIENNIDNFVLLSEAEKCVEAKFCWDSIAKKFSMILENSK